MKHLGAMLLVYLFSGAAFGGEGEVRIELALEKSQYLLAEPIVAIVRIINGTDQEIKMPIGWYSGLDYDAKFEMILSSTSDGSEVRFNPFHQPSPDHDIGEIRVMAARSEIQCSRDITVIDLPGEYRLSCVVDSDGTFRILDEKRGYVRSGGCWAGRLQSNRVSLSVVMPLRDCDRAALEIMGRWGAHYGTIYERMGSHGEPASLVMQEQGDSIYSAYFYYNRAELAAREYLRCDRNSKVVKYRGAVDNLKRIINREIPELCVVDDARYWLAKVYLAACDLEAAKDQLSYFRGAGIVSNRLSEAQALLREIEGTETRAGWRKIGAWFAGVVLVLLAGTAALRRARKRRAKSACPAAEGQTNQGTQTRDGDRGTGTSFSC